MTTLYHNPRCSKSRQTLQLLEENSIDVHVVEYLTATPDAATIKNICAKLGKKPADILRTKEEPCTALINGKNLSDDEIIAIMVENPIIIERPIVVTDNKAAIGRPPESVLKLFEKHGTK